MLIRCSNSHFSVWRRQRSLRDPLMIKCIYLNTLLKLWVWMTEHLRALCEFVDLGMEQKKKNRIWPQKPGNSAQTGSFQLENGSKMSIWWWKMTTDLRKCRRFSVQCTPRIHTHLLYTRGRNNCVVFKHIERFGFKFQYNHRVSWRFTLLGNI